MVESYSRRSMIDHDAGSSQYTTTTDSTIPGPGALGGKAIKALGKFTIRGIDRVIISARLRSITSKFPHTNEQAMGIKNLQEMYNVILELCRTGMYNQELRMKAIQLLVGQIKQGHTQALITALSRWHLIEVELLLPELIDNIIPIRRQPWGRNRLPPADQLYVLPDLTVITHGAQSSLSLQRNIADARDHDQALCTAYKLWFPQVFSFLSLVAGINPNTSKIVLQAGYLDLLLLAQKGNVPTKDLPFIFNVFLSRPQTFVPIVREKVINVILNDIIDGDIDQLIDALSKWPVIDLQALLMELETDQKLKSVLFKSSGSPSPFDRNIAFLFRVSQIRKSFVLAVLNAGFLDILKIAYDSKIALDDNKLLSFVFDIIRVYHAVKEYQSKAIDLLISYIIDRKTTFILSTLKNWDTKDLEDLITTIFQRAGPVGFDAEGGPFGPGRYGFHSRDGLYHFDQTKVVSVMTFAGKVARFNEAAFQAVINAGILDALLVIQSHDLSIHGLDEPFNIILEVLRPGTYSNKIRKKALDLLVFQVCRGEARYMLKVLSDWNFNELNRIIVEISAQFPAMNNRRALEDLFKRPQETQALSTVYLQRLLSFLAGVARLNEPAGQAVLETGFMDVLLALQNDKAHKMEYDDVDELMLKIIQKPQLHEEKIKKKALTYISVQTEREETKMSKIIAKRNIWQLETLINGMLEHFNYGSNLIPQSPRQVGSPIKPNDLESLGTCVNIFSKVILKHRFAFQAMINAGILDLLLAIQERQCSIDGIKKIYDIVLTSVFLDSVNDKALRILSHQILTGQSTCLLSALQKHGDQEFHIIAPAILTGLKRALFVHEGHISPCPGPDKRSLMNCIDFLQKLSQSNSSLFCHMLDMGLVDLFLSIDKSGISARALISLYTVLFEYARPIMYPVEVNTRVLDFVTDKLATEKHFCLTKALEKVDSLILNEIISHLFYRSKTLWSSCPPSFLGGQKLEQNWISFIKLMSAISRISPTACQSVLSHDFLDALYFMSQTKERLRTANKLHVKEAVISRATNSFLLDVIAYPEHRDTVFQHPVYPSVPTDTLQNIRKDELPLADWLSQIDFVLILVAAFAAVKSCKPLQYLYYTVLPCVTVCWSIIWMFILVRERPSAFDSIVTTMDM